MHRLLLFSCLIFSCVCLGQDRAIDSLRNYISTAVDDTSKADALHALTWQLINHADYVEAENTAKTMLTFSQKLNYQMGIGKAYNNIGVTYFYRGNYPKTVDFYYKALTVYEKMGNLNRINSVKRNIAMVYMDNGEEKKAEELLYSSIAFSKERNDKMGLAQAYSILGMMQDKDSLHAKEAIGFYTKALDLYKELKDDYDYAATLDNIGNVYYHRAKFQEAVDYYTMSIPLYFKNGYMHDLVNSYSNIGSALHMQKKFNGAEKYLKRSMQIADSIGLPAIAMSINKTLSSMFETQKDYKRALEFYKLFTIKKDSIYNDENKKELMHYEMNYEYDKKEAFARAEH